MHIDHNKIIRLLLLLLFFTVNTAIVSNMILKLLTPPSQPESLALIPGNSESIESSESPERIPDAGSGPGQTRNTDEKTEGSKGAYQTSLIGGLLNSTLPDEAYTNSAEGFYYAPLSENLRKYMTGNSYPKPGTVSNSVISFDDLAYVHVLYYDFEGRQEEGELICNKAIAKDLADIFSALYENHYPIGKVRLIDEYFGDDEASMEDNNSSCFNYRENSSAGSRILSMHAYGLAVDINPLYNPYISESTGGKNTILPASGEDYIDRSSEFAYKIDKNDLCYLLFTEHGFSWGGSWAGAKDYQHFEKIPE